ncbi:MAG: hypothetical protein OXF57_10865, partial [Rhodospirillaceae bacterium]|nr:hypothetical protein [Rhodospirillaceae bacterium]
GDLATIVEWTGNGGGKGGAGTPGSGLSVSAKTGAAFLVNFGHRRTSGVCSFRRRSPAVGGISGAA